MVFKGAFRPRKPGPEHRLPDGLRKALGRVKGRKIEVTLPKLKGTEHAVE